MDEYSRDRDLLIERHRSYAHALAADFFRRIPQQVEREDVLRYAELGLVEAATSFNPALGVQFKTFAYYRIRGAIYDGLRALGRVHAVSTDVDLDELAASSDGPDWCLETAERTREVRNAVARLPEKHRKVIEDYYFRDRTLEEIADRSGLSKSWVCRLHAKSIEMLKPMFG
jgi:RNA polymerase sigma factor FliA